MPLHQRLHNGSSYLVDEEKKLGNTFEQLAAVEREIAKGNARIAKQQAGVEQYNGNATQAVCVLFRENLLTALNHREL